MIEELADAVAAKVAGLGLTLGAAPLPVVRARQPRQEEGTSYSAQITVSPPALRPHESRRFTNRHWLHTVKARVVIWVPGNLETSPAAGTAAASSADHSLWEAAIFDALDRKPLDLLGIAGLRDCKAATASFLDRPAFARGWDVLALDVTAQIVRDKP